MRGERGLSRNRFLTFSCFLLFCLLPGATREVAAQETPPEAVAGSPGETDAEAALLAALSEAEADGRLVFLHTGADW